MALFKKDSDESAVQAALTPPGDVRSTSAAPARTYIAAGSHIEGSISGETEVLVDGTLEGSVELKGRFVLGRRGRIRGDVTAHSVQISGKVEGNVRATEKIEVAPSGSIEGNLAAPLVSIAEGGVCNGRIEMSGTLAIESPVARDFAGGVAESGGS